MVKKDVLNVTLELTNTILGSQPNTDIAKEYLAAAAKKELKKLERRLNARSTTAEEQEVIVERIEEIQQDLESIYGNKEVEEERKITVFPKQNGILGIYHYHILGLLKEVGHNFLKERGLKNKISRYVRVQPKFIPFLRNGEYIIEPDGIFSRPIRAITPAGAIVSIVSSEKIDPPAELNFQIIVAKIDNISTKKIKEILEIGEEWGGLLQWRTAGYGSYKIKEIKGE